MLKDSFARRFKELETKFGELPFLANGGGMPGTHVKAELWKQWATSAQNLVLAVFGKHSPHYENFVSEFKDCCGYDHEVRALNGIFMSAKEDFEGGYVFDVDLRVSGEVFGDFVSLARAALSEGHKDVAAVLACAALEDVLKRYAMIKSVDVADKTMQEVVNALKSSGLVAGAQKTLLDAMPKIRNFAMHAEWSKITAPDVSSVIGFVEQFLLSKFSQA
jgi:hypothetical protein